MTGGPNVLPPSVERLTSTSAVLGVLIPRYEIIHTLCLASCATDGSLARAYGPAGLENTVAGRVPALHVAPPSVDVEYAMSDPPPSKNRPDCMALTIVVPKEKLLGSTWVL